MQISKRGDVYWYRFRYENKQIFRSTKSRNRKLAAELATAAYHRMLKVEAGLEAPEAERITLSQFEKTFLTWVAQTHEDQPTTVEFYRVCFSRLLTFPDLADCPLIKIDAALVERFKQHMLLWKPDKGKAVGKTTINRYLATLRKAMHHACDTLGLIPKVPKIKLFPKSKSCERQREFIFTDDEYQRWLDESPEELRDASILARNCGICEGELLALQRDCVKLLEEPNGDLWGYIDVKRGLKREARRRKLNINPTMREVLLRQMARSKCSHVFAAIDNPKQPLSHYTLSGQSRDMKRKVSFDRDAGLHTLRHTYLTEMGKITDVFTLMRIAGHSNITTTQRYVHPEAAAMSTAAQAQWDMTKRKEVVAKTVAVSDAPEMVHVSN